MDEAMLGLATTRQLLMELEARGAIGVLDEQLARHRLALRSLEAAARQLAQHLPPAVLDYRTVD